MFEIPQEINEAAKGSLSGQNVGVPLPFAAPEMWWKNGEVALAGMKEIKDPRRFGGWGIGKDEIDNMDSPLPPLPEDWNLFEMTNAKGKSYEAFLVRSAWVAPIARRHGWFTYEGKSSSRVNYLCYLATIKDKKVLPWGTVVLSAKSFAGIDLDNRFKEFASKTSALRGATSSNFFYTPLGTFGQESKFETRKGKNGSESSVTPCQLFENKDGYTVESLKFVFVGSDVAKEMMELKKLASGWLDDWNKKKDDRVAVQPEYQASPEPEEENSFA
jgi:hypothetical protein